MRIQKRVNGTTWVDHTPSQVTPELQVLLAQRLRDAEVVGYPPETIITVLVTAPGDETHWRALP